MEKLARTVLSKRNTYYYIISIKTLSRNIPHAEKLAASNTFVSLSLSRYQSVGDKLAVPFRSAREQCARCGLWTMHNCRNCCTLHSYWRKERKKEGEGGRKKVRESNARIVRRRVTTRNGDHRRNSFRPLAVGTDDKSLMEDSERVKWLVKHAVAACYADEEDITEGDIVFLFCLIVHSRLECR